MPRRIFEAGLARSPREDWPKLPSRFLVSADPGGPMCGEALAIQPRLGQGIFPVALTSVYGGACAVTGEHSGPVLEAAHIQPFSLGGEHAVPNGLLLRADIHKLFDAGYVTITPEYRFEVSARLKEEWENGRAYYKRHGAEIRAPVRVEDRPSRVAVARATGSAESRAVQIAEGRGKARY